MEREHTHPNTQTSPRGKIDKSGDERQRTGESERGGESRNMQRRIEGGKERLAEMK